MQKYVIGLLVAAFVTVAPDVSSAQGETAIWRMNDYMLTLFVEKEKWPLRWIGRMKYLSRENKDNPAFWASYPDEKNPIVRVRMDFEGPGDYYYYDRGSYIAASGRWAATDGNGRQYNHYGQVLEEKTETIGKITYTKVKYQWTIDDPVTRRHRTVIFVFFEYGAGRRGYGMFVNPTYRWISGHGTNVSEVDEARVNEFLSGLVPQ